MPMTKKSIAIIGEGETEWFYFESLRIARRYPFKVAPDLPQHSDIQHIAKLASDYVRRQYDYVVCLVDMDRLLAHPAEMQTYRKLKAESHRSVMWVETNPCTELWFLLHFLPGLTTHHYADQDEVIAQLRRYMPGYEKTKRYLAKADIYNYLCQHGDLARASQNAEQLCRLARQTRDAALAYSQIHKVLQLLEGIKG